MITSIRYHPLVERNTDTHEYAPLFVTTDEAVVRRTHRYYLEEIVNGYYRLCAGKAKTVPDDKAITIVCPICGSRLENIATGKLKPTQALYSCRACRK